MTSRDHERILEEDDHGWWFAACATCAWSEGPFIARDDAITAHTEHADTGAAR